MRCCLFAFFCLKVIISSAQVTDIAPSNLPPRANFSQFFFDTKGGMYVRQSSSSGVQIDYFDGSNWFKVEGIPGDPYWIYGYNDELFVISRRPGEDHYILNYLKNRESGWDSIPVSSLNSDVQSLVMLPGHELLAKGNFSDAEGKYYLAKWSDHSWKPLKPQLNDSLTTAMRQTMMDFPTIDKKGNVYYYNSSNTVLRYAGNSVELLGGSSYTDITDIFSTANGKLYGDLHNMTPPAIEEWDGTKWREIQADPLVFSEPWIRRIVVNDKGEVLAAGIGRRDIENSIVKYSNGAWYPFGTLPPGTIDGIYFGNGNLYATMGPHIYKMPGDKSSIVKQQTKKITNTKQVDVNADEVWKIYMGYRTFTKSMQVSISTAIADFNKAENSHDKNIAAPGSKIANAWGNMVRAVKKKVTDLNIPEGKNMLVPFLLKHLENEIEFDV